jgi:hypothetical protein
MKDDPTATPAPGNERPRTTNGRFVRSIDTAERDAQAAHLRSEGKSLDQIASILGYADRSGAKRAVDRAFAAVPVAAVEELRTTESAKLDRLDVEAWNVLHADHVKVSNSGKIVIDAATGKPLDDPAPRLSAISTLLKIADRRARLLGLDMPSRAQLDVAMISPEAAFAALDAEMDRMRAEIATYGELPPGYPDRLD